MYCGWFCVSQGESINMKMADYTIALLFVCLGVFPCPAAESARPNIVMQWGDGSRRRLYLSVLEAMATGVPAPRSDSRRTLAASG